MVKMFIIIFYSLKGKEAIADYDHCVHVAAKSAHEHSPVSTMSSTTSTFFPSSEARSPPVICTLPVELTPSYDFTFRVDGVN